MLLFWNTECMRNYKGGEYRHLKFKIIIVHADVFFSGILNLWLSKYINGFDF